MFSTSRLVRYKRHVVVDEAPFDEHMSDGTPTPATSLSKDELARLQRVRRAALGSRLRQLRAARHMSQEALAHRAGINRSFYSRIESGAQSPTVDKLHNIAVALRVHVADLFRDPP
jgi:DNA-binding XRE family transcriptional regulator